MKSKKVKLKKKWGKNKCPGWDVSFSEDGGSIIKCDCIHCIQVTGWENYGDDINELQQ
tara:strand:+ start:182 stop:355 length:174 start_codon:yes stop_codon:yes gene_type:complete